MTKTRQILVVTLAGCMVLAGGCKRLIGSSCNKTQAYAAAQEVAPLRIPAGLDSPDTRTAMRIPELTEPEAPRGPQDPCLEMPPAIAAPAATPAR